MPIVSNYSLPSDYKINPVLSHEKSANPFWNGVEDEFSLSWQEPVYQLAASTANKLGCKRIVDVGCGTGFKTRKYFGGNGFQVIGVDQASGIEIAKQTQSNIEWWTTEIEDYSLWGKLKAISPEIILCCDVIEHLDNPSTLLKGIHEAMTENTLFILSTPNRDALYPLSHKGPPYNPRHVREWKYAELKKYVEGEGFLVVEHHDLLPRKYFFTSIEALRVIKRILLLKHLPDAKSCMCLFLKIRDTN